MRRSSFATLRLLVLALLLASCGPAVATATVKATVAVASAAPTETRAAELRQLATLTAPTPTSAPPTPNLLATQTRGAEIAQLATLTAPTATVPATATAGRAEATGAVGTFVGQVKGSEALLAIVSDGQRTLVYLCDGSATAQWFTGALTGERQSFDVLSTEGARVTAALPAGRKEVSGTIVLGGGTSLDFTAALTTGQDAAGLYRATTTLNGASATVGVIVLPNRQLAGAAKQGATVVPITAPAFGTDSLTASVAGAGTVTIPRVSKP